MTILRSPAARTTLRVGLTVMVVIVAVVAARALVARYQADPWTRDGRVRADIVQVAPDVGGTVTAIYVTHDQKVRKGDPLFQIDPSRYDIAVAQAESQLQLAEADAAKARAEIARIGVSLAEARREAARNNGLGDLVAGEVTEQSEAKVGEGGAALASAQSALAATAARIGAARNELALARLNRARTRVLAPEDGEMSDVGLRVGDYVTPGAAVLGLIDTASLRVEGYFEETKLPRIHPGQRATIRLMGEDKELTGRVVSVAGAIEDHDRSAASKLIPAINPTFSWVRLPQRIPVRIQLDRAPADIALIAGRTASVTLAQDGRP
ncbi:HlyD family secretion protein [Novosphingobium flavum]|uniref:HlyD family secretion protein n=1 Tax=Novosphingobium flavum TaxID=1778672 RepID=A0A7X1FTF1_9SPHN|nr:HlyD family secretion protein [Novosphingobium flavum]MBC2666137.1 HlyD family secretion protein [Novosphingobium flavum]